MFTRRQLLVSAAAVGIPVVAAGIPLPAGHRGLRLGLLQSQQPFIDLNDIAGSRERAFSAYSVLIRRSLEDKGPLDWLAGGAFPLSGAGPFPPSIMKQLALTEGSPEVQSFKSLAKTHRMKLTLGGWWRETGMGFAYRQLIFDGRGEFRALLPTQQSVSERVQLHLPTHRGSPSLRPGFARQCGHLHRYGAWIEMLQGPAAPPGAQPVMCGGTAIIDPNGELIARASAPTESCLVTDLA